MSSPVIANESELYVAPGGPTYRWLHQLAGIDVGREHVGLRIALLLLVTWVPMCVFALLQGMALGPTPRQSFLLDFTTYARFFVGIPVLVLAENVIGSRLRTAGLQFVHTGLVGPEDYPRFERAIARLARRRESVIATLVIIALAAFGAWALTFESLSGTDAGRWQSVTLPDPGGFRYNLAGIWSHVVALPVLLFLWYRWLWRIIFWTLFLYEVSRLRLRLVATHADAAGGLGFLEVAHNSFGIIAFGIGCMFSAEAAFRTLYEGALPNVFQQPVLIVGLVMLIIFLGPMLVFTPAMARTRRAALLEYGALLTRYNQSFEEEWLKDPSTPGKALLGSSDIQSHADLGNIFHFVRDMRYIPFGLWAVIYIAGMLLLPATPLILLVVPLEVIIEVLKKVAL